MSNSFLELGISKIVCDNLESMGYKEPTSVQKKSIPIMLENSDLLAQARTGTGKTAAFALPILEKISFQENNIQVIILSPTRELAIQITKNFEEYAKNIKNFSIVTIYGGQSIQKQIDILKKVPKIVVGTPGRIIDHIKRKNLNLNNVKISILDEADKMLQMGFIDDVETILKETNQNRQTALFSATIPTEIERISKKYLKNPKYINVIKNEEISTIDQYYVDVPKTKSFETLVKILEFETFEACLIFTSTKIQASEISEILINQGYKATAMSGDVSQNIREKIVEKLDNGLIDIVVATDVASRGLDILRISLVINYGLSFDKDSYIHRVGRTGRAGKQGKSISIISKNEKKIIYEIEKITKQTIKRINIPTVEEINEKRLNDFEKKTLENLKNDLQEELYFVDKIKEKTDCDFRNISASILKVVKNRILFKINNFTKEKKREFCMNIGSGNRLTIPALVRYLIVECKIDRKHIGKITVNNNDCNFNLSLEAKEIIDGHRGKINGRFFTITEL